MRCEKIGGKERKDEKVGAADVVGQRAERETTRETSKERAGSEQ